MMRKDVCGSGSRCLLVMFMVMFMFMALATSRAVEIEGGVNLIENGGFEDEIQTFMIWVRKICPDTGKLSLAQEEEGFWKIDDEVSRSGEKSVKLVSNIKGGLAEVSTIGRDWQHIPIEPGKKYALTAYYKLEVEDPGEVRVAGRVTFFDQNRKVISHLFPVACTKVEDWAPLRVEFFPPLNTAKVAVTLWFSGEGTIWWDDLSLKELEIEKVEKRVHNFRYLIKENPEAVIWKEAPIVKIGRHESPRELERGEIKITAARNQSEPFQLVVFAKKDLPEVSLEFTDLRSDSGGVISQDQIEFNPIGFIKIKEAANPALIGFHADPLLLEKEVDLKEGENSPFWVTVNVPLDAQPGRYKGEIKILSQGRELARVNLSLRVRSFAIPEIPYLRSTFYAAHWPGIQIGEWDLRPSEVVNRNMMEILKRYRIIGNPGPAGIPPAPVFKIEEGRLTITDWSAFDAFVEEKMNEYNQRWFRMPHLGIFGHSGGWFEWTEKNFFGVDRQSPLAMELLAQFVRQAGQHLRERGWLQYVNSWIWDEPPAAYFDDVERLAKAIRKGDPDFNIMVTTHPHPQLYGLIDIWCIAFAPGFVHPDKIKERKDKGDEIWFYNWPIYLDDYNYIQNRLFPWLVYMSHGEGTLLWSISWLPPGVNPWTEFQKTYWRAGHPPGMATLLYPCPTGKGPLLSSQRFAGAVQGIDDFDYFRILEEKINAVSRELGEEDNWGRGRVEEIIAELIYAPPFGFINDSTLLFYLRNKIGDEIEAIAGNPLMILVRTDPPDNAITDISAVKISGLSQPGTKIRINDKPPFWVGEEGRFEKTIFLAKIGENILEIEATLGENRRVLRRRFILKRDPQLAVFRDLLEKSEERGIDVESYRKLYQALKKADVYTIEDRKKVSEVILSVRRKNAEHLLAGEEKESKNRLYQALFNRARWSIERGFLSKAEDYLLEALKMDPWEDFSSWECQIEPLYYQGHFGFLVRNSLIEVLILESGGRILDFRVDGVSCLGRGNLEGNFSADIRADMGEFYLQKVVSLPYLGGYETANYRLQAFSLADWRISFPYLQPDKISIAAEFFLPGDTFFLRRIMTIRKNDPRLQITYEVKNVLPAAFVSDDPHAYDFPWRAHVNIGIGNRIDGRGGGDPDGDILVIPTNVKLPYREFSSQKEKFFEIRSLPLTDRFAGSFDANVKVGFAQILDPRIKHLYVWFQSGTTAHGYMRVYTLEPNKAIGVRPFVIKPGETLTFTNYLVGFPNITNEDQLIERIRSLPSF